MIYKNIIFYEDEAQLAKILAHNNLDHCLIVKYSGKTITRVDEYKNFAKTKSSVFRLMCFSFFAENVVCEYANSVPRIWASLFALNLESHIFGVLDFVDFSFQKIPRIKILRKIYSKLYADEYIIYGVFNPTIDLLPFLKEKYLSNVAVKSRNDLSFCFEGQKNSPWAVCIAQPWKELGLHDNEKIQHLIFSNLGKLNLNVFYCRHPRQKFIDINRSYVIDGWIELKEKIKQNGMPVIAISLSSSLIFELREIGVNAINLAERVDGVTAYPSLTTAQKDIENEMNKINLY